MSGGAPWASVVFITAEGERFSLQLVGADVPTLSQVERLARLQLAARRAGGRIQLEAIPAPLEAFLDLAGLLGEVGGQAEGLEEPLGLQEGVDPADAIAGDLEDLERPG
jgi:hypothetical protein